jgi:hypothetical protein
MKGRFAAVLVALAAGGGLASVSGSAGTPGSDAEPAPAAFRLADGSVGCAFLASGAIACRGADAESAVLLEPDGDSGPSDVEVAWDESTPVLLAAQSWWHGRISCRVRDDAVVCTAGDGGIEASPTGIGGVR